MKKTLLYFASLLAFHKCLGQMAPNKPDGVVKLSCTYRLSYKPDTANSAILTEKMLSLVAKDFPNSGVLIDLPETL